MWVDWTLEKVVKEEGKTKAFYSVQDSFNCVVKKKINLEKMRFTSKRKT